MNQPEDFNVEVKETSREDYYSLSITYPNSKPIDITLERSEARYLIEKLDNAI